MKHLLESPPHLRFGQRRVFCNNPFYNASLWLLNLNFKMDTKIKTVQNWMLNMKKDGIRTPRVRFEMRKIRIIMEELYEIVFFSVSH